MEILNWAGPASIDAKTVSYNEVPPDSVINEDLLSASDEESSTNGAQEVTFPILDNPWFSEHDHDQSDPLGLSPEDFEIQWVESCQFRAFKNVTIFSHAEFIHEYLNFKKCVNQDNDLDHWVRSHLKASTGRRGEMVIKTSFLYQIEPKIQDCNEDSLIIFAFSKSLKEREIVRETWGKNLTHSNRLLFLVDDESISDYQGDILQSDVDIDDPHYEFKQTLVMLAWLYDTCPRVRFVLKTTSDIFINQGKVEQLVEQEMFAANR